MSQHTGKVNESDFTVLLCEQGYITLTIQATVVFHLHFTTCSSCILLLLGKKPYSYNSGIV